MTAVVIGLEPTDDDDGDGSGDELTREMIDVQT